MPIDLDALREAERSPEQRIIDVLLKNTGKAYTLFELIAQLEGYGDDILASYSVMLLEKGMKEHERSPTFDKYRQAIDSLQRDGRVEAVTVSDATYYAASAAERSRK